MTRHIIRPYQKSATERFRLNRAAFRLYKWFIIYEFEDEISLVMDGE